MTEQDWSAICTILTQLRAAIHASPENYVKAERHIQAALEIARNRHAHCVAKG